LFLLGLELAKARERSLAGLEMFLLTRMLVQLEGECLSVISQNCNNSSALAEAILGALDLLTAGVVMVNSGSQVLFMNRVAEDILSESDGLEIVSDILQVSTDGSLAPIQEVLRAQIGFFSTSTPEVVSVCVRRSSGTPLTVVVRTASALVGNGNSANATTLVFILDPDRPVGISRADLRQLYGLTYTESNLVNWLVDGKTLEECRVLLGVRPSTVRMHLRNVLGKTGTASQGELVWLLFKNLGLVGTPQAFNEGSKKPSPPSHHKTIC
jgi:DNA-binding CsgD family transcriptional regulator